MNYKLLTEPSTEPLTLDETKLFLRVSSNVEDALITSLIKSARMIFENQTWRPLISQVWEVNLDSEELNSGVYRISKAPVLSVNEVTYIDSQGDEQTLLASNYEVDILSNPIRFKFKSIPSVQSGFNAVSINITCGYSSASTVPSDIKSALLLIIGHLYENRQDVITGTQVNTLPYASRYIMEGYKNLIFAPLN